MSNLSRVSRCPYSGSGSGGSHSSDASTHRARSGGSSIILCALSALPLAVCRHLGCRGDGPVSNRSRLYEDGCGSDGDNGDGNRNRLLNNHCWWWTTMSSHTRAYPSSDSACDHTSHDSASYPTRSWGSVGVVPMVPMVMMVMMTPATVTATTTTSTTKKL